MDLHLSGKVVIVTGATANIGRGIALAFAGAGARVMRYFPWMAERCFEYGRTFTRPGGRYCHRVSVKLRLPAILNGARAAVTRGLAGEYTVRRQTERDAFVERDIDAQ